MIWLLLLLGVLVTSFLHLVIPVCVAVRGKQRKKSSLWLIALAGGVLGFVVCAIAQEEFRGLAGILQSSFWTIISFLILKRRCYTRHLAITRQKCSDKSPADELCQCHRNEAEKVVSVPTEPTEEESPRKAVKTKYCSRCGYGVDNETKICTGCGKKYFRGFRFNKFSVTVIVLVFVIAAISTLCVLQYLNTQELIRRNLSTINRLESEISDLEQEIESNQSYIGTLNNSVIFWKDTASEHAAKFRFFDRYAVLVSSGSTKYHKYGCEDFDESSFWIYNIEAAEQKGYYACPKCH